MVLAVLVLRVVLTRLCKLLSFLYSYLLFFEQKFIIRFQHGGPSLFLTSKNVDILTIRTVCTRNLHVPAKFRPDRLNGYGLQVFDSHNGSRPPS